MTRRERVLAAVSHKQPDRIPIDIGGTRDSSIVVEGYERLKKHFQVQSPDRLCDRMMRVVNVDEKILAGLDTDVRPIFPGASTRNPSVELSPNSYRDTWGVERTQPEGGFYYDQYRYPLSGPITISDIRRYPWPDPEDPGYVQGLREQLEWIRKNTDCAAILTLPAPFIHTSQYLRGYEDWFCDFADDPSLIESLFDAILEINLHVAKRELEAVGKEVDLVICADDLGTQNGLQISYDAYKKYIKPRHRKYFDLIHSLTPAKVIFHSCGSLVQVLPDLIDIGVDILNPVQTTATGMNPKTLKKQYGKQLVFWGAVDTQHILPNGTVADVKRTVEYLIEHLGEGGGYVLAACHNLQPDVPMENILTMFKHAQEYRPSYAS